MDEDDIRRIRQRRADKPRRDKLKRKRQIKLGLIRVKKRRRAHRVA
jgi:hypothetical protein